MKHRKTNIQLLLNAYKDYYKIISGGIDGYYEKTILEADCYEVIDINKIAYFTVHKARGLTSLLVLESTIYEDIFDYVIALPFVTRILFTGKDELFMNNVKRHNLPIELQAINFESNIAINSNFKMIETKENDISNIYHQFQEFIDYNQLNLNEIKSFYFMENNEIICFGALEPMTLNPKRFCISMIVNETYRRKGYGKETVKFLINHLQKASLEVNARCYIKNEASKHILLASGLEISNYLYKVENMN